MKLVVGLNTAPFFRSRRISFRGCHTPGPFRPLARLLVRLMTPLKNKLAIKINPAATNLIKESIGNVSSYIRNQYQVLLEIKI